jgi:hypothetical protein
MLPPQAATTVSANGGGGAGGVSGLGSPVTVAAGRPGGGSSPIISAAHSLAGLDANGVVLNVQASRSDQRGPKKRQGGGADT